MIAKMNKPKNMLLESAMDMPNPEGVPTIRWSLLEKGQYSRVARLQR